MNSAFAEFLLHRKAPLRVSIMREIQTRRRKKISLELDDTSPVSSRESAANGLRNGMLSQ